MATDVTQATTTDEARGAALDALWASFDGLMSDNKHFLTAEGVATLDHSNDDAWEPLDLDKLFDLLGEAHERL